MTEINPIYRRYQSRSQSIETTLELIQDIMQERLSVAYRRIWVQASNSGRCRFYITIFPQGHERYDMLFHDMNIRQWRPTNSDNDLRDEIVNIEKIIEELRIRILSNIIS
jgi:hypothetical protein